MANEDVVRSSQKHVVTVNRSNDLKCGDASSAISGGGCILGRFGVEIEILLLISLAQKKLEPQGKPNWGTTYYYYYYYYCYYYYYYYYYYRYYFVQTLIAPIVWTLSPSLQSIH